MTERVALDQAQAEALHLALIDHQQKLHDRGLDLNLGHLIPPRDLLPPLPACPTCGTTPDAVSVRDSAVTLDTNIDFTPCGHGFRIPDATMNQLARHALS